MMMLCDLAGALKTYSCAVRCGNLDKACKHCSAIVVVPKDAISYTSPPSGCCLSLFCVVTCWLSINCIQDEVTRYRACLRSQNLFNKSHSVSHNIITGQARHNTLTLPPAPQ